MIEVTPWSPDWPRQYERARRELLAALPGVLLDVEHFGSTAVEGLSAKPVIDILCAVERVDDFPRDSEPALVRLGYAFHDAGMPRRLFYRRLAGPRASSHVHVVEASSWATRKERLFRDRLRAHPALRDEYADLKLRLAGETDDLQAYTEGKTAFVQKVVDAARRELGLPPVDVWETR